MIFLYIYSNFNFLKETVRESNQKFEKRIEWIDTELKNQQKTWQDCDEKVLDTMWNEAKISLKI